MKGFAIDPLSKKKVDSKRGGWNSVYTGIQPTIKLSTVLRSTGALDFSLNLNGGLDFSLHSKTKALYFSLHLK